jgi:hypothetical protein
LHVVIRRYLDVSAKGASPDISKKAAAAKRKAAILRKKSLLKTAGVTSKQLTCFLNGLFGKEKMGDVPARLLKWSGTLVEPPTGDKQLRTFLSPEPCRSRVGRLIFERVGHRAWPSSPSPTMKEIEKMTVAELKTDLDKRGLDTTGKKAELAEVSTFIASVLPTMMMTILTFHDVTAIGESHGGNHHPA